MPALWGGEGRAWLGGVLGGVECVEAAETLRESEVPVDCEAVDTFCRLRGGAIGCSGVSGGQTGNEGTIAP
jgi:hypothetical protein